MTINQLNDYKYLQLYINKIYGLNVIEFKGLIQGNKLLKIFFDKYYFVYDMDLKTKKLFKIHNIDKIKGCYTYELISVKSCNYENNHK